MKALLGMTAAAMIVLGGTANAATTIDTFDSINPGWSTDREAPARFQATGYLGDSRLNIGIDAGDYQTDPFHNTQGMQIDNPAGTIYTSIDLYITSEMLGYSGRVTGLWGIGIDAASDISSYPIIELADGGFQGYQILTNDWYEYGLPSSVSADQWVTLAFLLDSANDMIKYFVNGEFLGSASANGTTSFGGTIIQAYNTGAGVTRDFYYDNLTLSDTAPVPLPAAAPLLGSVLLAGGFASWRRRRQKSVAA